MERGDSSSPSRGLATVGGYEAAYEVVRRTNQRLVELLPAEAMQEVAACCGYDLLELPEIACEEMLVTMVDAALHAWPPEAASVLDEYIESRESEDLDARERTVLEAMARSRFALFRLLRKGPGPSSEVMTGATQRRLVLWDEGLASGDLPCGEYFVARTFEIDGEWLSTGAALPVGPLSSPDEDDGPEPEHALTPDSAADDAGPLEHGLPDREPSPEEVSALIDEIQQHATALRETELDLLAEALELHARQFHDDEDDDEFRSEDAPPPLRVLPKPGRNEPCPCGSGKKYKNCCGK